MPFRGALTALVTPFKDGAVDESGLRALIERQLGSGISGVVPCGTTGESATLSHEEHKRVIEITIEAAARNVPVIAGTGSNSTSETVMLTKHAEKAGADAALIITPYYNKPTQTGLYEHYKRVSEETELPLILYNVPSRTGVNLLPETVARLSELKNIVGVKEATADLEQIGHLIQISHEGFIVLSGDDATTYPLMALGGHGVISVTSNIVPEDMSNMCIAMIKGDFEEARRLHYKLLPICMAMFVETNPIPVKSALAMMGLIDEEFRLPLTPIGDNARIELKKALADYGLL